MTSEQRYGGDSRTVFLVIRGALWGLAAGAALVVLLELFGIVSGNVEYFGVFIVTGGPPALAVGAVAGIVVALLTWQVARRQTTEAASRRVSTRAAGFMAFAATVVGVIGIAWALTQGQAPGLSWLLFTAIVLVGVGLPVAGLAMFAAGRVHDVMELRFPRRKHHES